jgi:hypothetical protein
MVGVCHMRERHCVWRVVREPSFFSLTTEVNRYDKLIKFDVSIRMLERREKYEIMLLLKLRFS